MFAIGQQRQRVSATTNVLQVQPKQGIEDYQIDNQYFLEPGDPRVGDEIANIVAELLKHYPTLDGLQFDYIRYPDVHPAYGYTPWNMKRFKKATGESKIIEGSKIWNDWKREQVTGLLKQLVAKTRAIRPKIHISTTGCVSYSRAMEEAFQDWPSWVNHNIVEFVTVMDYPIDIQEFKKHIADAQQRVYDLSKLNVAVGAYKLIDTPEVFTQQYSICRASGVGGCVVFHYGSLFGREALGRDLVRQNNLP